MVRLIFLTVLLNSFSLEGGRLQKPHSPALKFEILRENGDSKNYKLVAVLRNDSKENQIYCENPVLETVTWVLLDQHGKG